jgi:hypothetical protein
MTHLPAIDQPSMIGTRLRIVRYNNQVHLDLLANPNTGHRMPGFVGVNELARELNVESQFVLETIQRMGLKEKYTDSRTTPS